MVKILIKSFYRPYLLDRCLYSIYHYVEGEYSVEVLDDGTPEKYLNAIRSKYPNLKISLSPNHASKVKMLEDHLIKNKKYNNNLIPTAFWLEKINSADSHNLILTEDDVWFTRRINISELSEEMIQKKIDLVQLGYPINHFNFTKSYQENEELIYYKPKLLVNSPKIYSLLLNNSYKLTQLLLKWKILPKTWKKQLWILYNIPMGIYNKNYLTFIWKDSFQRVLESLQLRNAVTWYIKNLKKEKKYAIINNPIMTTTFICSVSFNNSTDFDLIKFNHLMNDLWIDNKFDSLENFPNELTDSYIEKTLNEHSTDLKFNDWRLWKNKFINSFESFNQK